MAYDYDVLNKTFVSMVKTADGMNEIVQATNLFIRTKIREDSFFRLIIPPVVVTPSQCQRSVTNRGLVKIIDIEPDASAVAIDWKGEAPARYIKAPRYEVPFYSIESEEYQIKEDELLSYEAPVNDLIRDNSEKEIAKTEDSQFMKAVATALAASGKTVTSSDSTITKANIVSLLQQIDADQLRAAVILMNNEQFDNILAWDHTVLGDSLISSVTVDGYKAPTLLGRKILVTNKVDVVPTTEVYAFTAPEYLGNAYLLENDLKFDLMREFRTLRFKSWENIAAGIGNTKAVAKLTITG